MPARSATRRAHARSLSHAASVLCCLALAATGFVTGPVDAATPAKVKSADGIAVTNSTIRPVDSSAGKTASPAAKTLAADGLTPPSGTRLLAYSSIDSLPAFSLYGVTWDHRSKAANVSVSVRTAEAGVWSAWSSLDTDLDGGPLTTGADSAFRDGTEPAWVGDATGIEVAVYGTGRAPSGLKVSTIDPGSDPSTASAKTSGASAATLGKKGGFQTRPAIVTRRGWGADESLGDTCWDPRFGKTFKAVIIHHTAGSNTYTAAESKAVVRGIYAYHTQSRGWCDIGYNFLVDRFGTIFEGRAGGITRPVRGAHAGDYNVDTTGISLMGNFETEPPTAQMQNAVVRLAAWRLGTAYHGAYGMPYLFDGRFNRISGHRDVMATACPGKYVYAWLPTLRARVEAFIGDYESPIERYWRSPAGRAKHLGAVAIGERADAGGHFTMFQGGAVYASAAGRHLIARGPILKRYRALGQTSGYLRYPVTGVRAAGSRGSQIDFQGGRIYWSPKAGAHDLTRGFVLHKYRKLNGPAGRLGFPIASVVRNARVVRGRFQHGTITVELASNKVTVDYR